MKLVTRFLMLIALNWTAGFVWSQDARWPRAVKDGDTQIVVYQPQLDVLDGVTLQSLVAVSIKRPQDEVPLFGSLWVISTLDIDNEQDLAQVASVKIGRTRFADVPERDVSALVQFLENDMAIWELSISPSRLKENLQSAEAHRSADYRNDPPEIVVVNYPAILLLLDGNPRLEDAGAGGLQRVVNTALPVLFDPRTSQYWFYGSSVWFTTNNLLHGTWTPADRVPPNIADLVKDADTLASAQADSGKAASPAELRAAKIIVATEPTELIVTEGAPQYSPVGGGKLLFYVVNTDSDIFLELATQRHYIVISGRWFAGDSINGPWTFVSPEHLPEAFAHIPENSPKASDLAFVPGTERAKDAVMDSGIPQTAEISRRESKVVVEYDGAPQFSPIPNTSLAYAENTPSQVVLSRGIYYVCEDGVWYAAASPTGPWAVSAFRPPGIDDIPASSPVYNTKFVYIYDSTPDTVYVGYLPGYRWSLPYHGVVFYGTGWRYRGWSGRHYYPRPVTWGYFVRYDPWTGWSYRMSWTAGWLGFTSHWGLAWAGWMPGYGPGYHPGFWSHYRAGGWFGPGGYRPPHWHPPGRPAPGRGGIRPPRPGGPGNNLYTRPGRPGVRPHHGKPPGRPVTANPRPGRPGGVIPGGRGPGRPAPGTPRPPQPNNPGLPEGRGPGRPAPGSPRPPQPNNPGLPEGRGPGRPAPGSPRPPQPNNPGLPDGRGPGRPAPGSPRPPQPNNPGLPEGRGPGRPAPGSPRPPQPNNPGVPDGRGPGRPAPEIPRPPRQDTPGAPVPRGPGRPGLETPQTPPMAEPSAPSSEKPGARGPGQPRVQPGNPGSGRGARGSRPPSRPDL